MKSSAIRRGGQGLLAALLFVAGLVVLQAGVGRADQDTLGAEEVAARLQAAYDRAAGLSADFTQITTLDIMQRKRTGSGKVLFRKPGFMRWDYLTPDRQVLICDGEKFSIYTEKEKQLIIAPAKEYLQSDVTYSFFAGTGNLRRDFEAGLPLDMDNVETDTYLIKLTPRSMHPQIDHLHVWVTQDSFVIKRLQIISHTDTVTDLTFDHIKIYDQVGEGKGQPLDRAAFVFTPPAGTEIIEQ